MLTRVLEPAAADLDFEGVPLWTRVSVLPGAAAGCQWPAERTAAGCRSMAAAVYFPAKVSVEVSEREEVPIGIV
ncbi:MAG: hypothetical protein R3B90_12510 [Planctomycetaceae bacterium]